MAVSFVILESILLALSCSFDAFAASFAYGSKKIRIPLLSNQIINGVCCSVLGISLWIGTLIRPYLPEKLTAGIAFTLLFLMGITKLLDSVTKSIITRHNRANGENLHKEYRFTLFNFSLLLSLYANPEAADTDKNQTISPKEAGALAVSLSLDGMAVGLGAAMGNMSIGAVLAAAFLINMAAIFGGCWLGNKIARKLPFNVSWLSGLILIGLAVLRVR